MSTDTSATLIPSHPGRPAVITKWVHGVKTTFFVSFRDEVFLRTKREFKQARALTHPDRRGSAFLDTQRQYLKWLKAEEAWYRALGLETPDRDTTDTVTLTDGVSHEVLLLLAEGIDIPLTLKLRAYRLLNPTATRAHILSLRGESESYGAWDKALWRANRSRRVGGAVRVASALFDGNVHSPHALSARARVTVSATQSYVTRLRRRGFQIETRLRPSGQGITGYQFVGLTEFGRARLRQLMSEGVSEHGQESADRCSAVA